jgi:membrane protease YdiL (CAAX protease family)
MTANNNAGDLRVVFVGKHGLRPGWRFASFLLLYHLSNLILEFLLPKVYFPEWQMNWFGMVTNEWLNFAIISVLTWALCRVDRTSFSSYDLRISHGWFRLFGKGIAWGIVPSIVIVIPIWLAGGCSFHGLALARGRLIGYATAWALAFLGVGFAEEFTFRGYALQTLSEGIGFWPSATILSSLFGVVHMLFKPDEGWIDPLSVALYGMFWCLTLRRTGTLWFALDSTPRPITRTWLSSLSQTPATRASRSRVICSMSTSTDLHGSPVVRAGPRAPSSSSRSLWRCSICPTGRIRPNGPQTTCSPRSSFSNVACLERVSYPLGPITALPLDHSGVISVSATTLPQSSMSVGGA